MLPMSLHRPTTRCGSLSLKSAGWLLCLLSMAVTVPVSSFADEPLHRRIDQLTAQSTSGLPAALCTDAEFLRRVSLDLVGTIPSAQELREFLQDERADKRMQIVDKLLADPRYALHQAEVFDALLMERRPAKHVPAAEWLKYLQTSFRDNKPWNELVREMVTSDGTDPATRPAARFFLDRDAEPHIMTRDIGRIFFGVDLQCAQCHDHPLVDHYAQSDYYGLFAFVNRTTLFNYEKDKDKQTQLGELAEGNADYKSVFTQDASRSRPRLPGGPELDEPHFALGDEYQVAPADKVRPVPKHSRRAMLAVAADGSNAAFNRNLPNRLWAHLFGRGLVHPVDWHHPHNPPVHPQVLDTITESFVASGYDIRALLRELVLSEVYQRSIDTPANPEQRLAEAAPQVARLASELEPLQAVVTAAEAKQSELYDKMKAAGDALVEPDQAYAKAVQAALALKKPIAAAEAELAKTQPLVTAKQTAVTALTEAHAKATAAVTLLKDDAELAQALAVFEKKRAAAAQELEALQKKAADQTAAVQAARDKWNAAVAESEQQYQAYLTAAAPWEQLKQEWYAARQETLRTARDLEFAKLQNRHWQHAVDWAARRSEAETAASELAAAETARTAAEAALKEQEPIVAAAKTALTSAQEAMKSAAATLDTARVELTSRQETVKPVTAAVAATEAARQKLPEEENLQVALAKLKDSEEPLQSAVKMSESTVAIRTAELDAATKAQQAAQAQVDAASAELKQRQELLAMREQALQAAQAAREQAVAAVSAARETTLTAWEREFAMRAEKPLSPEQLTHSMMTATDALTAHQRGSDAEIEKTLTLESVQNDPAKLAERAFLVEQMVREKVRGNVNAFINLYAAGAGQPQDQYFATADQALFVANGNIVRSWLNPAGENLTARLQKLDDASALADELYSGVLGRVPSDTERSEVVAYLKDRTEDRLAAIQELAWALLSSAEFRFSL